MVIFWHPNMLKQAGHQIQAAHNEPVSTALLQKPGLNSTDISANLLFIKDIFCVSSCWVPTMLHEYLHQFEPISLLLLCLGTVLSMWAMAPTGRLNVSPRVGNGVGNFWYPLSTKLKGEWKACATRPLCSYYSSSAASPSLLGIIFIFQDHTG